MIRTLAALAVVFAASPLFAADATKLEGTWKLTKSETPLPPGAVAMLVINKAGTYEMKVEAEGKKYNLSGSWKLDGDKLTTVLKTPDGKEKTETMTIKTLTDTDMVTVDGKGKTEEFKKSK